MTHEYEKFLKNKRRKYRSLKEIYKNEKAVKDYWQNLGEHKMSNKDFTNWKKSLLYDHTWQTNIEAIIKYGELSDGEKILDIGCGWGRILVGLKKYFPHSELVGVDIIPELLKKAETTIKEETGTLENLDLVVGNIDKLPFKSNSFDKVISIRVLQYVTDPLRTVKELNRVTKKGGRVMIIVPNKLNPRQVLRYHTKLYQLKDVYLWFKENKFIDIKIGTIRFLPRLKHKLRAESSIRMIEKIGSKTPLVKKLGGLIICSGKKINTKNL